MMHCFFANKRRHTRFDCDWSSDVCSSDLHACTEREALERLVSEAELGHDRLSRVRIDFDSSIHRRITLWVPDVVGRSEGRRVGKERRSRWSPYQWLVISYSASKCLTCRLL